MKAEEAERYGRQMRLEGWGAAGQERERFSPPSTDSGT